MCFIHPTHRSRAMGTTRRARGGTTAVERSEGMGDDAETPGTREGERTVDARASKGTRAETTTTRRVMTTTVGGDGRAVVMGSTEGEGEDAKTRGDEAEARGRRLEPQPRSRQRQQHPVYAASVRPQTMNARAPTYDAYANAIFAQHWSYLQRAAAVAMLARQAGSAFNAVSAGGTLDGARGLVDVATAVPLAPMISTPRINYPMMAARAPEGVKSASRGIGELSRRQRLVWTPELHAAFIRAVEKLGVKTAVPKAIMKIMDVEGLTRENVASHLQKYRLQLKRAHDSSESTRASGDAATTTPNGGDSERHKRKHRDTKSDSGSGQGSGQGSAEEEDGRMKMKRVSSSEDDDLREPGGQQQSERKE